MRDERGRRSAAVADQIGALPVDLEFAVSIRRAGNGMVVMAVTGEVDLYTSPQLERVLEAPEREGARQLVLDLSGATFVDSTALHVLLRAARRLEREQAELIVVVPDPNVRKVFELTGFDRLYPVVETLPNGSAS